MCVYSHAQIRCTGMCRYRYIAISHNTLLTLHSPHYRHYCINARSPFSHSNQHYSFGFLHGETRKESIAYQYHIRIESLRTWTVLRYSPLPKRKKCTFWFPPLSSLNPPSAFSLPSAHFRIKTDKTKWITWHFKVGSSCKLYHSRATVPPNGPHGFAGHRKATAPLMLGWRRVAGAPGAPVRKAMLPVLPASRRDMQRGRGRSSGLPGRSWVDPPISPDYACREKRGRKKKKKRWTGKKRI